MEIKQAIDCVIGGSDLSAEQIAEVFGQIMDGEATPAQIGGLLVALRIKGETSDEIAGAARAMRQRATPFRCADPDAAVDTCGTGGDGSGYVNVSTIAAIVTAAAGGSVAKHGNRALSSRSGSADVLEALGVKIDAPVTVAERCLERVRIAFLFAPAFHAATRHAAGPRRELGTRTIFNLLGPITNPAGVRNQIIGVYDRAWCEPIARALGALGSRRAFVVHGAGAIDEIAVRGPTLMAEWDQVRGTVVTREVTPADFGLREADPAGLVGGDAAHNAGIARAVLAGEDGPVRTAILMESAVALHVLGLAGDFREGVARAAEAIDRGDAVRTLASWVTLSNEAA
ncbi:MAG TPA: anthranilate phosphoribosyltransferase [Kofleriaceae bacterium]|nr:anthranilate phosphoribosyltransferase [Kofleriaceae bacterium]